MRQPQPRRTPLPASKRGFLLPTSPVVGNSLSRCKTLQTPGFSRTASQDAIEPRQDRGDPRKGQVIGP